MYKSEKRTIFNVLTLYLSSTLLLIATLFIAYYYYQKEELIHNEKDVLKSYTLELEDELNLAHTSGRDEYEYPRFDEYNSAIYDIDKNLIFSTLNIKINNLDEELQIIGDNSYYISALKPYYLGAAYIVIEKKTLSSNILSDIVLLAIFVIIVTIITSFFLVKLVLKPLRDNISLLDDFIKDTTHELNNPITTILANIETLDSSSCDEKSLKKLKRIQTASTSISNIYQDLVYILLNHKVDSNNDNLNLSTILNERIQYFTDIASSKKIIFALDVQQDVFFNADEKKIERLIDNIVSNAIKYTKVSSTIKVILNSSSLSVIDEGKGMSKIEISNIFERYKRFDKVEGGFGIGYSIIKSIIDEYNIKIDIRSRINMGTEVRLQW